MNIWTLIVPAALFFFGAGMLFPLATTGAMEPFPYGRRGGRAGGRHAEHGIGSRDGFLPCCRKPGSSASDC